MNSNCRTKITTWQRCYNSSWSNDIVSAAYSHPAKFSKSLIFRLVKHLLTQGYIKKGDTVLDCFAGVGLGALPCLHYGLRWIGVELEDNFRRLGQANLDRWQQRYGLSGGTLLQGDSRQLRAVLAGAQAGCVIGSPPYVATLNNHDTPDKMQQLKDAMRRDGKSNGAAVGASMGQSYGASPGQLGALPPGSIEAVLSPAALVSSPPYAGAGEVLGAHNGIDWTKTTGTGQRLTPGRGMYPYGRSEGQLANMAVVSSPPYEGSINSGTWTEAQARQKALADIARGDAADVDKRIAHALRTGGQTYGSSPEQLGNTTGTTFWEAAAQIVSECAALLPPGGIAAWVLKGYVKDGKLVNFPAQWLALCESHGFRLVEEIHASLVESYGTQEGLFGEADVVQTERKSFFRRLHERRPGAVRIDHETILILAKEACP